MILILDVDETLVHSDTDPDFKGDFKVGSYTVKKRPHLDEFIKYITNNPNYSPGVWSAGMDGYVRGIVEKIFPDSTILKFIETRDFCNERRDKPLSKIRKLYNDRYGTNLSRSDFLIIDDREGVTKYDELNHIQIERYMGSDTDDELLVLIDFLKGNVGLPSECLVINWQ
jgi:TFIIF-interacting CTD phosphatase-like protein